MNPLEEIQAFMKTKRDGLTKMLEEIKACVEKEKERFAKLQEEHEKALAAFKERRDEVEYAILMIDENGMYSRPEQDEEPVELQPIASQSEVVETEEEEQEVVPEENSRPRPMKFTGAYIEGRPDTVKRIEMVYEIIAERFPRTIRTNDLFRIYQGRARGPDMFRNLQSFRNSVHRYFQTAGLHNYVERPSHTTWVAKQQF